MTFVVLDDHLLRDLLADEVGSGLATQLAEHQPATTNLYYVRLCRNVVTAPGGKLTGSWPAERRRALGSQLVSLPDEIAVVPIQDLAFEMAELAHVHRLSTLGAEAVAAARHLDGALCVWDGDDGPGIKRLRTLRRCRTTWSLADDRQSSRSGRPGASVSGSAAAQFGRCTNTRRRRRPRVVAAKRSVYASSRFVRGCRVAGGAVGLGGTVSR